MLTLCGEVKGKTFRTLQSFSPSGDSMQKKCGMYHPKLLIFKIRHPDSINEIYIYIYIYINDIHIVATRVANWLVGLKENFVSLGINLCMQTLLNVNTLAFKYSTF